MQDQEPMSDTIKKIRDKDIEKRKAKRKKKQKGTWKDTEYTVERPRTTFVDEDSSSSVEGNLADKTRGQKSKDPKSIEK